MQPYQKYQDVTLSPLQDSGISTLLVKDYAVSESVRNEEMLNL
jgi:hypothetical protein